LLRIKDALPNHFSKPPRPGIRVLPKEQKHAACERVSVFCGRGATLFRRVQGLDFAKRQKSGKRQTLLVHNRALGKKQAGICDIFLPNGKKAAKGKHFWCTTGH